MKRAEIPVVRAGRSWAVPETEGQALVQHVSGSGPEATPSPHSTRPLPARTVLTVAASVRCSLVFISVSSFPLRSKLQEGGTREPITKGVPSTQ